jgi:ABC-type cobalamin/Fe3+-siderophores transport system ATPase subunit
MEETLYLAINGAEERLRKNDRSMYGNIMIIGKNGSGRTTLAADLIEIIRMDTGLLSGITGRITGANLNQKDLQQVYDKIRGGCLIIEEAGQLNRETAVSLSLLMENDKGGTLVILEDKDKGYRRLRAISQKLIDMFTERIEIPDMTIDELVNFGKVYIKEQGYTMDDMAVLALYDKINIMQHQGTTIINLTTIRNILEDALAHAKDRNSGLFGLLSPRNKDDSGNRMLIEKDFV